MSLCLLNLFNLTTPIGIKEFAFMKQRSMSQFVAKICRATLRAMPIVQNDAGALFPIVRKRQRREALRSGAAA